MLEVQGALVLRQGLPGGALGEGPPAPLQVSWPRSSLLLCFYPFPRYLADATKAKASLHTASCISCRQVVATGEEIKNPANPTYPCVNKWAPDTASLGSPHPFPLAGVPGDRQETGLIVLSKLLAKAMLTGGPVWAIRLQELASLLVSCRADIWARRKIYPEGLGGRRLDVLVEKEMVTLVREHVLVEEESCAHLRMLMLHRVSIQMYPQSPFENL